MIRINVLGSSKEVVQYYVKRQSLEAYYADNQEFNGFWAGEAAKLLGLQGAMNQEEFGRLAGNLHLKTGEQLTVRMNPNRRSGFDVTFDCPKSVSLLYAYSLDDGIIWAMRQAVADLVKDMEKAVATRVRAGLDKSADKNRATGNLVAAEIIHLTARPEDGFPDPHLHIHLVVFNTTFDPVEKKWKAIQMGDIVHDAPHYQAAFHKLLAENLQKLGLDLVATKDAFEIAGIPRDLIEKFSRRTRKINETAERLGITDPAQKARLGALTRERKDKSLLISELRPIWLGHLSQENEKPLKAATAVLKRARAAAFSADMVEAQLLAGNNDVEGQSAELLGTKTQAKNGTRRLSINRRTRPAPPEMGEVTPTAHDFRAVEQAVQHIFERASAATELEVAGEAFRSWCVGRATKRGIEKVIAEAPFIRREREGVKFVTTAEVVEEEDSLIEQCLNGKWQHPALNPHWQIEDQAITGKRAEAVKHVLSSRDWLIGIEGEAGTGKTTMLHEIRRGIEAEGRKLIALAVGSEAARSTLRNEGFKNAETVARLLVSKDLQAEAVGAVLAVDEAGLMSTRQAKRLFDLAQALGARLLFIGDTGQHHAVERGQAFELLQKYAHLSVARVDEVLRQKGVYKEIVELVAKKKVEEAVGLALEADFVKEMPFEKRMKELARDYVDALERGPTALVVAPAHFECDANTAGIREELKKRGKLTGGVTWNILRNLSWTEAQKGDADHYRDWLEAERTASPTCRQGPMVQFNARVKGFALGERVEVIDAADGVVRVRRRKRGQDSIVPLPLKEAKQWGVYEPDTLEICEGDCIRITCNGQTKDGHRLQNRNLYNVNHIDSQGRLVFENGWRLEKEFPHIQHGWTMTSHAAQGKTVDVVLLSQSAKHCSQASDLRQFYVSISRGRSAMKIYTDDIELLTEWVSQARERPMATDILQGCSEERAEKRKTQTSAKLGQAQKEEIAPVLQRNMAQSEANGVEPQHGAAESFGRKGVDAEVFERLRRIIEEREKERKRQAERERGIAMGM